MKVIWAVVTTTFEGIHSWPDIPVEHPKQFLKNPHRHLFHVTMRIEQLHNNRDVEYLVAKDDLISCCNCLNLGSSASCEDIASELIVLMSSRYPNRRLCCEVTEDGENGALIELSTPI